MNNQPPDRIYLQWYNADGVEMARHHKTFTSSRRFDQDVEYVRVDALTQIIYGRIKDEIKHSNFGSDGKCPDCGNYSSSCLCGKECEICGQSLALISGYDWSDGNIFCVSCADEILCEIEKYLEKLGIE